MTFENDLNSITIESLRATGASKWSDPNLIGAFVAEMDFGVAPPITAALKAAVDRGQFGYLPKGMREELSAQTADFVARRHGWKVDPADVYPIPDVIHAFELAMELGMRPDAKIIVPTPAYMPFISIPGELGRDIIEVPMGIEGGRCVLDLDGLQRAFDDGGQLLVLSNPNNPMGRVFERQELLAIAEVVERNGGRVLSDEIWAPMVYTGHQHVPYATVSAAAAGHTLTATSASKGWNLPGLKCAQVILSNDRDREAWARSGHYFGDGTANLGAVANAVAYSEAEAWLEDVTAYLEGSRDRLTELVGNELPGVKMVKPEGTYIAWLDFTGTGIGPNPAAVFKERAGIALTDGARCGRAGVGSARLVFATPRPILENIVTSMASVFREYATAGEAASASTPSRI